MKREYINSAVCAQLLTRAIDEGGFKDRHDGTYRPEATAWGLLILPRLSGPFRILASSQARLVQDQAEDGRVRMATDYHDAFWPTSLAILAWRESPQKVARDKAIQFLLATTGQHVDKRPSLPVGHDTTLKGWPWIAQTHSWVEPTALAVIALTAAGYRNHPRVSEAVRMLMDRQLPHGGWNYGNTKVFGKELLPAPETTGAALHALMGRVSQGEVQRSIDYLSEYVSHLRTPISLGWALLGLQSWRAAPADLERLVHDCLKRQERYGQYDTASLCLVLLPLLSPTGLYPQETHHAT